VHNTILIPDYPVSTFPTFLRADFGIQEATHPASSSLAANTVRWFDKFGMLTLALLIEHRVYAVNTLAAEHILEQ
jgi:hypothetical protein